jgi:hypothetical protein
VLPELAGDLNGVNAGGLPPGLLVARAMDRAMMRPAERHREFIARLAAERARLNKLQNHWLPLFARPRTWAALGSIAP